MLAAIKTVVLGALLNHGWVSDKIKGESSIWAFPAELRDLAEWVDRLADANDVEGLPLGVRYALLNPGSPAGELLTHVTGSGSLAMAWNDRVSFAAHTNPRSGRIRWVAINDGRSPQVLTGVEYYRLSNTPSLVRELIQAGVLPRAFEVENARAVTDLLGLLDEHSPFAEELLPSHVTGAREAILEWALAHSWYDWARLASLAGLAIKIDYLPNSPQGKPGPGGKLMRQLKAAALRAFIHQARNAVDATASPEEYEMLLRELKDLFFDRGA